jgi:hypothetical protein
LKKNHQLTKAKHLATIAGTSLLIGRTRLDIWSLSSIVKLELDIALIQWIVKLRKAFTTVEDPDFQMLYTFVGTTCPITSVDTLKCWVLEEYKVYHMLLKQELANTCSLIALSFNAWTSPQGIPILRVISYWLTL